MHRNADSALKLGQAAARRCALPSHGSGSIRVRAARGEARRRREGRGAKGKVQLMVKTLLRLEGELGPDAADASASHSATPIRARPGWRFPGRSPAGPGLDRLSARTPGRQAPASWS